MRRFYSSCPSLLMLFALTIQLAGCGGGGGTGTTVTGDSSATCRSVAVESCPSNSGSLLVGTWLEIALNGAPEGNPATDVYYSDGTVTSTRAGCDIRGIWSTAGNQLTTTVTTQAAGASVFCDDVGTVNVESYTVDETTLTISGTEVVSDVGSFDYTLTYTRQ